MSMASEGLRSQIYTRQYLYLSYAYIQVYLWTENNTMILTVTHLAIRHSSCDPLAIQSPVLLEMVELKKKSHHALIAKI
jgi:hypothetical protein